MSELVLKRRVKFSKIKNIFNSLFENNLSDYEKFNEQVQKAAEYTLKKTGIQKPEDYLLKGSYEAYGKAKYEEHAPQVFLEIPDDMLTLPTYNSLLPDAGRSNPGVMGFRHLDEVHDQNVFNAVHESSLKYSKKITKYLKWALSGAIAFPVLVIFGKSFTFSSEYAQYLSPTDYVYQLGVGVAGFIAQGLVGLGTSGLLVGAGVLATASLVKKIENLVYDFTFYNRLNASWQGIKHQLTYYQSLPTRQGRVSSKEDEFEYVDETSSYINAVKFATTKLKDDPKMTLGTYTGLMASKGVNYSPIAGSVAKIDITSFRTHCLILGETGSGKSENGMIKLARQFLQQCYNIGHTCGILVLDGKGVFATQVRDRLPEHLRREVYICGTGDGAYGIDLMSSLSPDEFADQYQNAAGAISKSSDTKWISGAADRVRDAGYIMHFIQNNPKKLDISELWGDRTYSYYSILGVPALAVESSLRKPIAQMILEKSEQLPPSVVGAARNFLVFEELAKETQTSYTSNITDVFSKISGTLADRFASGSTTSGNTKFVDLAELDNGAFIGMSLSAADDNQGGIVILNIVKSVAYTLAQKRDTAANRAREMLSRIDEQIDLKTIKLAKQNSELTLIRSKLTTGSDQDFEEVIDYLNKNFTRTNIQAKWSAYKKVELLNFLQDQIDKVEKDLARYTTEVIAIAAATRSMRKKALEENPDYDVMSIKSDGYIELEKVRDSTSKSSVLILIDEAHFFLSGGNSISSDTFFLSIARSTGRVVLAATQSLEAIYAKMSEHDAASMINNFGTKIIMKNTDPKTQDMIIRAFGTGVFNPVHAPNGFANYDRLLNKYKDVMPSSMNIGSTASSFNLDMNNSISFGNYINVDMQPYDSGHRQNIKAMQHENNAAAAQNETHSRQVALQAFSEELDRSGVEQDIIKPDYMSKLSFGEGFVIVNRANRKIMDKVVFDQD